MIIQPDINQVQAATNILTNNYVNVKIFNDKIIILNNPDNLDIIKILTKEFIRLK